MDKKIFDHLFGLTANRESFARSRVAAAIYHKGSVVSVGFNRGKTHPFQKKFGKNDDSIFLHAEIDAILQAKKYLPLDKLSESSLYIIRRKKKLSLDWYGRKYHTDTWGLAKPCSGCTSCIRHFKIKNVFFSLEGFDNYGKL